ncbi:MAG TPA: HD domain-containing phosphohydrolase [Gallionellaceae bacterium]|nr:HD domain-containing phosphohydrolase [Gallionellaceae bacterium]
MATDPPTPALLATTTPDPGKVCGVCGKPLAGSRFLRHEDSYHCESCVLKRDEYRVPGTNLYLGLAEALAEALDAREHETGLHSKRVACHTLVLARRFTADDDLLHQVYWGALLHDIGKIGIPDAILLKRSALSGEEWGTMRTHPGIGHRILSSLPFLNTAAEIVLHHEERFDGTGYPDGLRGEQISLWARLFAVIDTLDAMISDRPYREGMPFEAAQAEIQRMSGTQFDPQAVAAFMAEHEVLRNMSRLKYGEAIYDTLAVDPGAFE